MTWWAAVLGFVGALGGSWGGQLIVARREDRRWDREREREEERWRREQQKEINQRIFEERKLAYGSLVLHMSNWCIEMNSFGLHLFTGGEARGPKWEVVEKFEQAAAQALRAADLLADKTVINAAKAAWTLDMKFMNELHVWDLTGDSSKGEEGLEKRVSIALEELKSAARADMNAVLHYKQ